MEFKYRDKYKSTRDRTTRFKSNHDISDKEIIEFLDDEISQYRDLIRKQREEIEKLKNKQKPTLKVYKELEGLKVELKGIKGTIENIGCYKANYYADNLKYYEETFYEIEILTDDMFTVRISPIAKGTLKEMHRVNKVIKEYELNNRLKII